MLKGREPITCRPGLMLEPVDFEAARKKLEAIQPAPSRRDLISWCLYPKVMEDYFRHRREYGYIMRMSSHVFFSGMYVGETTTINIEDGKTLVIKYLGFGDVDENGMRSVQFELNGMRREVAVPDPKAVETVKQTPLADPDDKGDIGASIPGLISKLNIKTGDVVEENQVVAIIEAMKMETSVVARMAGVVEEVLVRPGQTVKAGELLIKIK